MYQAMTFQIIKRVPVPTNIDRSELMSIKEAAEMMGVSMVTVTQRIDRGTFTEIVDDSDLTPSGTPRRYVLRSEVEKAIRDRDRGRDIDRGGEVTPGTCGLPE